ncbi:hypothetical protein [Helicobacter pylori]|uniref:hypothetical protein n=1 Tax=Helicobacter pylori TaxID=210 RepID=UPI001FD218CE|nr:hypothetical protein [Helicobacter pylori]UOR82606.1 hypothetical protein MPF96_00520 [Helicobacter pylori]
MAVNITITTTALIMKKVVAALAIVIIKKKVVAALAIVIIKKKVVAALAIVIIKKKVVATGITSNIGVARGNLTRVVSGFGFKI